MVRGGSKRAIGFVLAAMMAGTIAAGTASAQNGRFRALVQQRRAERQAQRPMMNPNAAPKGQPNVRAMEGLPPKWVSNMRNMSPEEQDRFMQNDARFRNLPPQRQEQIRNNLQKWNGLTPEQQQAARNNEAALERMTPQQRQYVRNTLLPKWQAMPPARRQVINRHLAMLSKMSPSTQEAALNDPKFTEGLSPDEQGMLRDLNSLRNPPPAPAVPERQTEPPPQSQP